MKTFVAYYRVSTQQQGRSGLGIEAQRAAVTAYVEVGAWVQIAEFEEHESGKGADALSRRPVLRDALAICKKQGATLIIAKLDRLARNVHFVSGLLEAGVDFVAADMPQANKVMLQMHACMSEWERDQISSRTRAALVAAKGRGVRLGVTGSANLRAHLLARSSASIAFSERLRGLLGDLVAAGLSQRAIAARLNELGIGAPRGGNWSLLQLQRILRQLTVDSPRISPDARHARG